MFNPEKLLGGLLRSSARGSRGGLGGLIPGGAALGALGVAMEAVEHFMNTPQRADTPPPSPGVPPPAPGSGPASPRDIGGVSAAPPPPPPMSGKSTSVHPSPVAFEPDAGRDAVLLIRSMIAAANADGVIDGAERSNILKKLQAVELSPEEHGFIVQELLSPANIDTIISGVDSPQLARQVYTVSLLAIDVDTDEERQYMESLADRLGLDASAVGQIHRRLELA